MTRDPAALHNRVRAGETEAAEELYRLVSQIARHRLLRQIGPDDFEDRLHDVYLAVLTAIRRGSVTHPERLPGFIETVAQRSVFKGIRDLVVCRNRFKELSGFIPAHLPSPQEQAEESQDQNIVRNALAGLSERDRQVLIRFYLEEESRESICASLGLSPTQFRLLKSRAKTKFGQSGQFHLQPPVSSRLTASCR